MTSEAPPTPEAVHKPSLTPFGAGAVIGVLGGLIGLGGAEFRQLLLIGLFRFDAKFLVVMALGSICGTFVGGQLLGYVPEAALLPVSAMVLLISAWKVWQHR